MNITRYTIAYLIGAILLLIGTSILAGYLDITSTGKGVGIWLSGLLLVYFTFYLEYQNNLKK